VIENQLLNLQAVIQGCREGNERCQELLYKNYYGYVISIALRYLSRRELAEEAVNDCFLKVFNHINNYDNMKSFKTWIRQIAVNTCIDLLRKENRFVHTDKDQLPEYSINETATGELNYASILKGLDGLPMLQRLVFNMYEIEGYNHAEISEKLGMPESSSRTYLTRAKKKLQLYYQELIKEKNARF
jgi:RNA polymerase sigma-70 factor (ECF subfamily)